MTPEEKAAVATPASLATIAARVDTRLRALLDDEVRRWADLDVDLVLPLQSLARLVLGSGKRLRPAFCHWGYVGAGGEPSGEQVVDAGAAFEMLHAFALIHDDVMDGSPTRRGAQTTHLEFAAHHAVDRWRGEARRFGEGVAILVGDLAFVYADLLMRGAPEPALDVWNELRVELNIGQYLDILGTARGDTDHAGARRIASYKSGKYTVERPLHLGAALTDRLDDLHAAYSAYGLPLGEAFQLRDDILGAFGDSALTGKPVGDDLREGKPTPLLAITVSRCGADAQSLLARVGAADLDAGEVAALQSLIVETGALDSVEEAIGRLTAEALDAIEAAPITEEARVELAELAHYVAWRDR